MGNLKVECLTLGVCQTNCYYIHREDSREVIFFDPADKGSFLYETLQEKEFKIKAILLTHGHFDHVEGLPLLKQRYRIRVFASHLSKVEGVTDYLTEGDLCETPLKDCQIMAMEVPGHTSDHLAYVEKYTKAVFSGDTLCRC